MRRKCELVSVFSKKTAIFKVTYLLLGAISLCRLMETGQTPHQCSLFVEGVQHALADEQMPAAIASVRSAHCDASVVQLRNKLIEQGVTALSNRELIELLLRTGTRITGQSTTDLATAVLQLGEERRPGSSLVALRHISSTELQRVSGIGEVKAATILAALELGKRAFIDAPPRNTLIESPEQASAALASHLMWEVQERFAVLHLDVKNRLLRTEVITVGTATETLAHPRDIFRSAVQQGDTVRLIVAHNHPSGSLDPSNEDIALTKQLIQSSRILGIPIMDHLILGEGKFLSLKATSGLWNE